MIFRLYNIFEKTFLSFATHSKLRSAKKAAHRQPFPNESKINVMIFTYLTVFTTASKAVG